MDRRHFLGMAGASVAAGVAASQARARSGGGNVDVSRIEAALAGFRDLPGRTSYQFKVPQPGRPWIAGHRPQAALFVGSAVKSFINVKFLQDVEAGRLSEQTSYAIDNDIRSLSSPLFLDLTGTTPARFVLEAMISCSDNTATDVALKAVGVHRVRAFLSNAGLGSARIPGSTRLLFSYLAGAPFGVDKGWAGMEEIMAGKLFGKARSPMNNRETMKCSAADFVTFFERALERRYFRKSETLTEFKRIQSMADAISRLVPPDIAAYAKGGSIEWEGFNALCVPGQMIVGGTLPVTFCFTVNWDGPPQTIPVVQAAFVETAGAALRHTAEAFG